jgi:anti-sigma regulatory factor (Ser/Thr protein kinase)
MTQSPETRQQKQEHSDWEEYPPLPGTQMELIIPARLDFLNLLGAAVREYCAALPHLFAAFETTDNTTTEENPLAQNEPGQEALHPVQNPPLTILAGFSNFVYSTQLVLQEAASNIVRHGYHKAQPGQLLRLKMWGCRLFNQETQLYHRMFLMELADNAPPFDPTAVEWSEPDPLQPRESGYGLYLIRKLTNGVSYRFENGFNRLRLVKDLDTLK